MSKPLICVTGRKKPYAVKFMEYNFMSVKPNFDIVEMGGGISVMASLVQTEEDAEKIMSACDGLFVTGGDDADPASYGEEKKEYCDVCYRDMDIADVLLIKAALKLKKPVLGFCRGIQAINIAFGGTLYQDLKIDTGTEIVHPDYTLEKVGDGHPVNVVEGTPLYALCGDKLQVNSCHHQGIKDLGEGLSVMARAEDGLVESVYADGENWVRGYQWHPEFWLWDPVSKKIIDEFISKCK